MKKGLILAVVLVMLLTGCSKIQQDTKEKSDTFSTESPSARNNQGENELFKYPDYPEIIFCSSDYEVTVKQGTRQEKLVVYDRSTCVETWRGRSEQPDRFRRFCEFAFTGDPVEIRIKPNKEANSYRILTNKGQPQSRQDGNEIVITLLEPQTFLLELDGEYNSLLTVFADQPEEDIPDRKNSKVLYIEGYYEPEGGYLTLDEPDTCLYLAPGAVLCARVNVLADRIKICGRGVILDPWSNLLRYDITKVPGKEVIKIQGKQANIEGIKILDARNYNLWAQPEAEGLSISNVKVLSTQMTTDGLTLLGVKQASIKHCFFYCGDNAIVLEENLKGTKIEDCMVGTPCAAVFPQQDLYGDVFVNRLYVFRADEGIINNRYNNKHADRVVKSVLIENLNAVDCRNLPWFFHGRFMGKKNKHFIFRNIWLPEIKCVMDEELSQPGSVIRIDNYPEDRQTGGYQMDITNLYVGGKHIKSVSELRIKDERQWNNTYEVRMDETEEQIVPAPVYPFRMENFDSCEESFSKKREAMSTGDNLLEEKRAPYASIWNEGAAYMAELTVPYQRKETKYQLMAWGNEYEEGKMITAIEFPEEFPDETKAILLKFQGKAKDETSLLASLCFDTKGGLKKLEKILPVNHAWNSYEIRWDSDEIQALKALYEEERTVNVELELTPIRTSYSEICFKNFQMYITEDTRNENGT